MSDIIPNVVVSMPNQLFTLARKFQAASNGKIFIGEIDTDPTIPENQIQVHLENEDGTTVPVSQPLIINQAGYPVYNGQIAKFVTVQGHSMAVYDSYGAQQFYYPNVLKYDPDQFRVSVSMPDGFKNVGMIESVSDMKAMALDIGTHVYVKSYIAGKNIGGGFFESVPVTTDADEVIVFSGTTNNWKRINFGLEVSVYDAGYYDGQDIAVYINKVNRAGYDCTVPGNGTFSSVIEIDVSKGALIGTNKCKLTEASGVSGDYAVRIFNGNTDYSARDFINANASISGVAFNFSGEKKISIGGAGTGESSEIRISNCGFIGSKGIEFLDNSYRILFDKCTISRSFYDTVIFNSPANSGEMIKFSFCWIVDNGGPLTLENGQFIFEGCSLPAGKKDGWFEPTVHLKNNATAVFSGGNIEFQPNQSFVAISVTGSSRLCVRDSTLLIPGGYSSIPIISNDDGVVSLNDCSLPLYDHINLSAGAATRQVIGGESKKIISKGCYPRSGFIISDWHKGNIVSPYINYLSNGSGQLLNYANWSLVQTGTGVVVAGSDTDTPNDIMHSRSLFVSIPSEGAKANFYQESQICEPGRYFQYGFWAKSPIATVASIEFFDKEGNSVHGRNEYAIPSGNEWAFYALIDTVPIGASKARINYAVSGSPGSVHIHNVIYGLI